MRRFVQTCLFFAVILMTSIVNKSFGQNTGYVKMEIGVMGLHCPFLGVTLKEQLTADSSFSDLKVDRNDNFLTFSYTKASKFTADFFQSIAVNVGYPAEIITITLSDSQPPIQERTK